MNRVLARLAGFAVPTVTLVTALHVAEQPTWREGIDGAVSGAWFTLPFAATTWLRSRLEGHRSSALRRGAAQELAFGLLAAAVTWTAIWLGWTLASASPLRQHAFTINSLATAAMGLALPPTGRRARKDEEPLSGEVAPGRP